MTILMDLIVGYCNTLLDFLLSATKCSLKNS